MNNIIHSSEFPSLAPSPDPTVIRDYSPITNYIKERIEKNRGIEGVNGDDIVDELQAVLSKIEELEKKDNSKGSFLGFFRGEEMYYGNDVYKKYCAERELQELNKLLNLFY